MELGGAGWKWMELGGGGWSWLEVVARFSDTCLCDEPDFPGHHHENVRSEIDPGENEDGQIEEYIASETYFEVVATDENLDKDIPEMKKILLELQCGESRNSILPWKFGIPAIVKHCKRLQWKHLNGRIRKKTV